nr:MAG TPA: hypothetical protein [Caudoviricetes sp.]
MTAGGLLTCPGRRESVVVDHQLEVTEDLLVTCRAEILEARSTMAAEDGLGCLAPIHGADHVSVVLDVDPPHLCIAFVHAFTSTRIVDFCLFMPVNTLQALIGLIRLLLIPIIVLKCVFSCLRGPSDQLPILSGTD